MMLIIFLSLSCFDYIFTAFEFCIEYTDKKLYSSSINR